jgi:hypothetical protein
MVAAVSLKSFRNMPDWLSPAIDPSIAIGWPMLAVRLALALAFGLLVAAVYRGTRNTAGVSRSFPGTLVLLCVLIAMVTQVIGTNVALAFSLVGALSIVRFRTAVQDTRDTAFVIFAVASGMAIGAGQPAVAVVGSVAVGCAAWLFRDPRRSTAVGRRAYDLGIRLGWSPEAEAGVRRVLLGHDPAAVQVGGGTAKKGASIHLAYRLHLPQDVPLAALIAELKAIESVQNVQIHQPARDA